jgi:hypothetical protein
LSLYPDEESILKPFLPVFSVTWGRRRQAYNTGLSVYFLKPEPSMSESFGFEQEIMLVYSSFNSIEPRAIQAAESFLFDVPARGRVERLTYYFISEAPSTEDWFRSYVSTNQESRLVIPIAASDLRSNASDAWFVRNKTAHLLYGRDLFDHRLPLERDTYFFGRSELVVTLFDAIKRSENRGIFGLRKTGKTSLLFKLERMLRQDSIAEVVYVDCKLPSVRGLRWFELLARLSAELTDKFRLPPARIREGPAAADDFIHLVESLPKAALIVFDEVEFISPASTLDEHWRSDFIDFWQVIWACQSRFRKLCTILAGVNPSVVEMDTVAGVQNPLFGIVSYQFLTGLNDEETRTLVRTLGKRMGVVFDYETTRLRSIFSRDTGGTRYLQGWHVASHITF